MNNGNNNADQAFQAKKKKEMILLGVLLVVAIPVIYYQFFADSGSPVTVQRVNANGQGSKQIAKKVTPAQGGANQKNSVFIVSEPLEIDSMTNKTVSAQGTGRNIFIYPTPTPVPPPKPVPPPPPPPITLFGLSPGSVIGKTGDFTLTVVGDKIPSDAKIFVAGREFQPTSLTVKEIKTKIPADLIKYSGSQQVTVRSVSDSKLFSNELSFTVTEPPPPPYKFVGFQLKKGNVALALVRSNSDESVQWVSQDQTLARKWKVVSINNQRMVVEDVDIKVTHTINFTG